VAPNQGSVGSCSLNLVSLLSKTLATQDRRESKNPSNLNLKLNSVNQENANTVDRNGSSVIAVNNSNA
jgi:hypothetical protein